jgi:hypothetical protein
MTIRMTVLILVLLIPAAFWIGRFFQWVSDAKRAMNPWNRQK